MPYLYDENAETEEKKVERLKMAQELVKRHHPMRNVPLSAALPFLEPFARCFGCINRPRQDEDDAVFTQAEGAEIIQGEDTQKDEDQQRILANQANAKGKRKNDPFLVYGAGVQNYFKLQENLLWLFFFLTICSCFQMMIYKSYGGMDSFGEFVTLTASVSFGNMGFSSTVCAKMPIDWQHDDSVTLHAQCQGSTTISDVLSSGMMLDTEFPGGNMDAVLDCYYDA